METEARSQAHLVNLFEKLAEDPTRFGFLRTLRELECLHEDKPRFGTALRPADEPIRLGQEPSALFATSTLSSFEPAADGGRPRLQSLFLGLFGPHGPLPLHITEYARDRSLHEGDDTLAAFADVFHHRTLMLFYRAWASANPSANFDRADGNRFADFIGSFLGVGTSAFADRDAMPGTAKLYYAGRLSSQTNNAEGLQAILSDYFGLPVELEQFVGHWLELPDNAVCRLGEDPDTGELGVSVMVGTHFWDCQQAFRVKFGPLCLDDYIRLLPSGDTMQTVTDIVRNYAGDAWIWDMQLVLDRDGIPPLRLGEFGELGWTTWLCDYVSDDDADDLVLSPLGQV